MNGFNEKQILRMSDLDKMEVKNRLKHLSPAPRPLTMAIKCKLLTGGSLGYFGLMFAGVGLIFALVFVLSSRVLPSIRLVAANTETMGEVVKIESTSASVGGSRGRRGTPVFKIHFKFKTPEGGEYHQFSYVTGGLYNSDNQLVNEGDSVKIQYVPSRPKFSRIVGARYSTFGAVVLLTLLFPVIGLTFVVLGYRKGLKQIYLLGHGNIADGKITGKVATGTKVNNIPEMKYLFEYKNSMGETCKGESRSLPRPEIGDEKYEPVVYVHKNGKNYAELVDALPKNILLNEQGQWHSQGNFKTLLAFFTFETLLWLMVIILIAGGISQTI